MPRGPNLAEIEAQIYTDFVTVDAQSGYASQYKGERLDQFDEDLFLVAMRQARDFGLGPRVQITLKGLTRALKWDLDLEPGRKEGAVVEVERDEFRSSQGAGEPEQQQRPIAYAEEAVVDRHDHRAQLVDRGRALLLLSGAARTPVALPRALHTRARRSRTP